MDICIKDVLDLITAMINLITAFIGLMVIIKSSK